MKHYKISQLAKLSELTTVTIRHYDKIGLIKPIRSSSGYRLYTPVDLEKLTFIKNAKASGFTLEEIKQIFQFMEHQPTRKSAVVKQLIFNKLDDLNRQSNKLKQTQKMLNELSKLCTGEKPVDQCPILKKMFKPN